MKKKFLSMVLVVTMCVSVFVGCGKEDNTIPKKIEETESTDTETSSDDTKEPKKEASVSITGNFGDDVEAGLLYADPDTLKVVDKDGNPVPEYDTMYLNDRSTLADEYGIIEGYLVDDDWKIVANQAYIDAAEQSEDTPITSSYKDTLLSIADSSVEGRELSFIEKKQAGGGHEIYKQIVDDRSEYHSDIIYGNWWENHQVNGIPVAKYMPKSIGSILNEAGLTSYAGYECHTGITLDDFYLIDQDTCTVDSIKRSDPNGWETYAFYLQNCQKHQDDYGNVYIGGYIDTNYVAVFGDFSGILNGDNVFMYADYVNLSINDTPIFVGAYAEILN